MVTIPTRNAQVALFAIAVAAGLAVSGPAATADQAPSPAVAAASSAARGKALISQFESSLQSASSISFSSTMSVSGAQTPKMKPVSLSMQFQKPNLLAVTLTQDGKSVMQIANAVDGGYVVDLPGNRYTKLDKSTDIKGLAMPMMNAVMQMQPNGPIMGLSLPLALVTQPHPLSLPAGATSAIRAYDGTLNGVPVTHVTESMASGPASYTLNYYVDKATQAPVQIGITVMKGGATQMALEYAFSNFKTTTTAFPDSTFQYTPPSTMTAFTPSTSPQEPPVLANGAAAPDFSVQDVAGHTVKLSDYAGKVVVIDFWATWCGPCQESLPGTDKIAKSYQTKGVVFLPVCSWDDKSAFTPWVKKRSDWAMTFYFDPAGRGDKNIAASLFKVSGIPTQFVIGKDGKVVAGFVGYNGPDSEKSLSDAIDKAMAAS